jgi:hypothetical protein
MNKIIELFENERRSAEIHLLAGSQQYVVYMHNDMGHDFKAYFHKEDLDKAKSFARGWVEQQD